MDKKPSKLMNIQINAKRIATKYLLARTNNVRRKNAAPKIALRKNPPRNALLKNVLPRNAPNKVHKSANRNIDCE